MSFLDTQPKRIPDFLKATCQSYGLETASVPRRIAGGTRTLISHRQSVVTRASLLEPERSPLPRARYRFGFDLEERRRRDVPSGSDDILDSLSRQSRLSEESYEYATVASDNGDVKDGLSLSDGSLLLRGRSALFRRFGFLVALGVLALFAYGVLRGISELSTVIGMAQSFVYRWVFRDPLRIAIAFLLCCMLIAILRMRSRRNNRVDSLRNGFQ